MSLKISICVRTHNRDHYLGRALRSLIDQTFPRNEFEIIVVDDGSTDKTSLVLNTFKDEIKVIKNKKNLGLSKSLNKALKIARGRYFIRVDSDDYVNSDYLNFLYQILNFNKEKYNASCCDYYLVNDNEKILKKCNAIKEPIGCGILFKMEDILDVGMYSENVKLYEEKDLIKKLKKKKHFKIIRLPIPLYRYKYHANNMTKKVLSKKLKKIQS